MTDAASIVFHGAAMSQLIAQLDRLAEMDRRTSSPCSVVIYGETGTGKDLIARRIHEKSGRNENKFAAVNCSALPEQLFESEVFGHERGAFTGANAKKKGLLEVTEGGTLFLDEIADLPLQLQVKLLRALQNKVIRRVGGVEDIPINVRVIAASNRDLPRLVAEGAFRSDLLFRLNVFRVHVPPLRDRREDIPGLVEHFCQVFARRYRLPPKRPTDAAHAALLDYQWPGNVRELENTIEYAYIASENSEIDAQDLAPRTDVAPRPTAKAVPLLTGLAVGQRQSAATSHGEELIDWVTTSLPESITMHEVVVLFRDAKNLLCLQRFEACDFNATKAAKSLGIDRRHFYRMLRDARQQNTASVVDSDELASEDESAVSETPAALTY